MTEKKQKTYIVKSKGSKIESAIPSDLIEIFPYGLTIGSPTTRPVLLFKDEQERYVLPVWLGQLESALAVATLNPSRDGQLPHGLLNRLMEKLGLKIERCVINEMLGHHQYMDIEFAGKHEGFSLRVRVDDGISACLAHRARFFSTVAVIRQSRDMDAEITNTNRDKQQARSNTTAKIHPFLM